jgi:hypothetical protein
LAGVPCQKIVFLSILASRVVGELSLSPHIRCSNPDVGENPDPSGEKRRRGGETPSRPTGARTTPNGEKRRRGGETPPRPTGARTTPNGEKRRRGGETPPPDRGENQSPRCVCVCVAVCLCVCVCGACGVLVWFSAFLRLGWGPLVGVISPLFSAWVGFSSCVCVCVGVCVCLCVCVCVCGV